MKHVTNCVLSVIAFMLMAGVGMAEYASFEGPLYHPGEDDITWQCDSSSLGEYGGALGVKNGTLYGAEWACKLKDPQQTDSGTQFIGQCHAEGLPYRDLITLRKTYAGILITTEGRTSEWLRCPAKVGKSKWTSGFGMGVVETKITNGQQESVIFECGVGTDELMVGIHLGGSRKISGPVALVVDGVGFNFDTQGDQINVNTTCKTCLANYGRFMKALYKGQSMTVVPRQGSTMLFDVSGAKNAFHGAICGGAGHLVEEDQVDCKFIVDFKMMHWGKCSIVRDETSVSFYTVSDIKFFIPIHFNDDKKTATGYWNGPTGGNHAHGDLGKMKREGNCWRNIRNSICFEE